MKRYDSSEGMIESKMTDKQYEIIIGSYRRVV